MKNPKVRFKDSNGQDFPDWEESHLNNHSSFHSGLTYSPDNVTTEEKGILVIRSTNIQNGLLVYNDNVFVDVKISEKLIPHLNDTVMCVRNGSKALVGKNALIKEKDLDKTWGAFMTVIRSKENNAFIHHFLNSPYFKKQMDINAGTSTINQITSTMLNECKLSIPCLEEQEKIADFLSAVDEVVTHTERELQNLQTQKKAVMQSIFSQKVRFKDSNGQNYPNWEDGILKDWCTELKGTINPKKHPNDTFIEYSMPSFDLGKKPSFVTGNDMNSNRKVISTPCVLINKLNVRKQRIWKVDNPTENSVCSAEFIPVTSQTMNLDFLQYLALSSRFTVTLLDCSTGTSNSQQRVTPDIIMNMEVSVPCLEEQEKIAEFLTAFDVAISKTARELELYRTLKKGLLQQLFI